MALKLVTDQLYLIEDTDGRHFGRYLGLHPALKMYCFSAGSETIYYAPDRLASLNVRPQWESGQKHS